MSTGLIWFRNDLRINDQQSLALSTQKHHKVIGVYCFDPRQFSTSVFGFKKTEKFRTQFLIETVTQLKLNLAKYNIPLFVYSATPETMLPEIVTTHNCTHIYCQKEWTAEELQVTTAVKKALIPKLIAWVESYDQFLFHPDSIPFSVEKTPQIFTHFRKSIEKQTLVLPIAKISSSFKQQPIENNSTIPKLTDLGFDNFETPSHSAFPFKGGENAALDRLHNYIWVSKKISYYKKTRNGLLGSDYSSKFSAWLANGSISAKTIYFEIKKYEKEVQKNDSTYWLIFELIWRDYFKYISLKHQNAIFKIGGILNKEYAWSTDLKPVNEWINGTTGKTFVDANMLELQHTGWMSNRGRQNVASYFAKDLLLDWRIGAAYFEAQLIDYDVHSNYGNWMYVAGVGNDPRDRKFNVDLQAKRYDPNYKFQRLWLQPTLF
ncbi:DASH family cryptochrome [Aquimarina agarilytica]|uniref:DASH family cryptochrome n=1 Tax=Aquimarina agarilytica TaxID=1087449 RepID=UPI000287A8FE|nr:DASH family cryptochrome [Aquimarina agarilytica]